ncbi:MAG: RlmE family RNA methyltransferase [Desulfobacteraceae bacterium]|nr:MAG: RlmE family RNA methyltransferase [Desulfobacteraceae bacterium]
MKKPRTVSMGKSNTWEDHYTRRAREERWLARSVYKLEEIDRKSRLIRSGDRVLDLGCYPGSWSQYSVVKVGPKGEVVGVDVKRPDRFSSPRFRFIEADVLSLDVALLREQIGTRDLVISDLAPATSGISVTDTSRSIELARRALEVALAVLKKGGHFLCKVFEGPEVKAFRTELAEHFARVQAHRPSAVRKASREIYLLALNRSRRVASSGPK